MSDLAERLPTDARLHVLLGEYVPPDLEPLEATQARMALLMPMWSGSLALLLTPVAFLVHDGPLALLLAVYAAATFAFVRQARRLTFPAVGHLSLVVTFLPVVLLVFRNGGITIPAASSLLLIAPASVATLGRRAAPWFAGTLLGWLLLYGLHRAGISAGPRYVEHTAELELVFAFVVTLTLGWFMYTNLWLWQVRHQELRRAQDQALDASRTKEAFLANMSHELRSPMNGVLGLTSMVLDTDLEPKQREHLELAHRSATALLGIIDDVLDLSRLESGHLANAVERVDAVALVRDVVAMHRPTAERKGLALSVDVPANHLWVMADGLRLRQVLANLVDNAVKYTSVGWVRARLEFVDGALRIEVEDSGPGVPASDRELVFSRFERARAPATGVRGTGLGLAIVRKLVEAVGGRVWVEGDSGACFVVCWPVLLADPPTETPELDHGDGVPRREVLIVDDDRMMRIVAEAMVEKLGHHVTVAEGGAQALALLERRTFDVVLMDCYMPELDGFETTRRLRGQLGLDGIPVLALTASVLPADRERCLASGMDDVLAKPIDYETLGRALATAARKPS